MIASILAILPTFAAAQTKAAVPVKSDHSKRVEFTDTETLWRDRYANCDYGFYVLLPHGVVGHANLPPNPNHGFLIGLPAMGTNQLVSFENERFLWVQRNITPRK